MKRKAGPHRFERGEGKACVFWEVTRAGALVTTRFGKHLGAGRTLVKEHLDERTAEVAVERAIAEKLEDG